jgi:hypothetical protein
MKTKLHYFFAMLALFAGMHRSAAQGTTAFTYQGQLHDGGTNANGAYTMVFALYDAASAGNQVGSTITNAATLANGLFTVNLDFGNVFTNGSARWLDITIQTETLTPRVQILPSPYALYSSTAGTAANLASGTWNATAGTFLGNTNVFGISANNSLVLGLTANGVLVNGNLQANGLKIGSDSLSDDGNGGLDINNGDGNANLMINNLTLNGDTVQFPAQSGANIAVDGSGDFTFDNNIRISALGVLHFPGPSGGGGDISGVNSGLLISSGIQQNGALSVFGNVTCNPPYEFYGNLNQSSDRNLKEKFTPVNSLEVLNRVAGLPISSWDYKQDAQTHHIGPMAQDFYAAFNVGTDDKHINTVDEGGVALAAIQGLNEKLKERDVQIEALNKRLADLEQLVKASMQK